MDERFLPPEIPDAATPTSENRNEAECNLPPCLLAEGFRSIVTLEEWEQAMDLIGEPVVLPDELYVDYKPHRRFNPAYLHSATELEDIRMAVREWVINESERIAQKYEDDRQAGLWHE